MVTTPIARLHDVADALTPDMRRGLDAVSVSRSLEVGDRLMRAGSRARAVYEIRQGRVQYSAWDHHGCETVLIYMTRGDWVGLSEAFPDLPALWNGVALEPLNVREVRHRDFLALIDTHPGLSRSILRLFAHRFSLLRLFGLSHGSPTLKERVVKMLYFLSFGHEKERSDSESIELNLSQEELGNVVGASRQKLNSVLRTLQDEGLLTLRFLRGLTLHSRAVIAVRCGHLRIPGF